MDTVKSEHYSRRAFMQRAGAASLMGTAAPLVMNLATMGEAAAQTASDYKAIVCLFMFGGNDYGNTLIPADTPNYDLYSTIRGGGANRTAGGIAYGQADLAATTLTPRITQTLTDNIQYALHPQMTYLKALWDGGVAAAQLNVGPLIVPLTLAQYKANNSSNPLPPKLFSHNDQQSTWQSDGPEGTTVGWGGRIGDLSLSSNTNAALTCISANGNALYLAGQNALVYRLSSSGPLPIRGISGTSFLNATAKTTLQSLITQSSSQMFENEYAKVVSRSISLQGSVSSALAGVNLTTNFNPSGVRNTLAEQMKLIAQLIAARNTLGVKRQIFFASIGGFDNHDFLQTTQPGLLQKVSEALYVLYQATAEMGIANQVTAFTASDFGRTLASNGDGSDHGWGSQHFLVGGAVNGGKYYGTAPKVSVTSDDQVGQGRLLPSTATDQLAATLASWFGVANSDLPLVNPNIANFTTKNLGYFV